MTSQTKLIAATLMSVLVFPLVFPCPFICSSLLLLVVFSVLSFSCSLLFWADTYVCSFPRFVPDNLKFFEPEIDNPFAARVQRQQAVLFHTYTPILPTFPTLIWLRPHGAKPNDRTPLLACDVYAPCILPKTRRLALILSPPSETGVLPTPAVWQARLCFCQDDLVQTSTSFSSNSHPHL